jgi:hypothetical protein
MQNIRIKIDTKQLEDSIAGMKADTPWVIQNTINDILKLAQEEQYNTMRKNFTIRNEAFLKYSVRIGFANRQNLTGKLFIADLAGKRTSDIWNTFEGGGTKTPTRSRNIAVPTNDAWPNRASVKPQRNKPRNLKNSFILRRGGNTFILQRQGRRRKLDGSGREVNVKLMYTLTSGVRIPDRLQFYDTVVPIINNNFDNTLERLLRVSMKKRGFDA